MRKLVFLLFAVMLSSAAMADGGPKVYEKVVLTLTDGRVFDIDIDSESFIYSYTQSDEDGKLVQYVEVSGKSEMYLFERGELQSIKFVEAATTDVATVAGVDESNPMRYIDQIVTFIAVIIFNRCIVFGFQESNITQKSPAGKFTNSGDIHLFHFRDKAREIRITVFFEHRNQMLDSPDIVFFH